VLALEGRFGARGLRVIGVSATDPDLAADEKKSTLEAAREEKMTYPTYLDENGAWSKTAEVTAIPAFLVVSPAGKILFRHRGKLTEGSPAYTEMAKTIEGALSTAR